MASYPEIYLLRHGQTEWNLQGRLQGRLDSALTDLGRKQAKRQGEILRRLGLADTDILGLSSPQGRAQETARLALAEIGKSPILEDRLCETDLGSWQNRRLESLKPHCPAELWRELGPAWYYFNTPDGESFARHRARCKNMLESLNVPTILVTHGITSKLLRGLWLGLEYRETLLLPGGQGCVYQLKDGAQYCHWA